MRIAIHFRTRWRRSTAISPASRRSVRVFRDSDKYSRVPCWVPDLGMFIGWQWIYTDTPRHRQTDGRTDRQTETDSERDRRYVMMLLCYVMYAVNEMR